MAIVLEKVSFAYHSDLILDSLNYSFKDNKLTVIIGANGAGKSTLISLLIKYYRPLHGNIFIDSQNLAQYKESDLTKIIAYVPQRLELNYRFTALEYVSLGLNNDSNKAIQAMKELDITRYQDRYVDSISGGEQQLLNLARAYAQNTKWLILDEPTANLDYKNEMNYLDRLKSDVRNGKKSIIMTIHNPQLALDYADEIVILNKGKIITAVENDAKNYAKIYEGFKEIYGQKLTEKIFAIRKENENA